MFLLHAIIFSTGGAILALELLASRIMTPYFGVSIYIWTGILSITLVALAAGYWCGGLVTHSSRKPSIERLAQWYLAQPAWAGLAIVGACLVYPYAFHSLASFDLVVGAFIACMVLLFLPLLTTSAMNPLLVAIMTQSAMSAASRRDSKPARGDDRQAAVLEQLDAGSGRVFFVSTVGSVAGVIVTAFVLMPYMSNYNAVLAVALVLSVLSLAGALRPPVPVASRSRLLAVGIAGTLASGGLLAFSDTYLDRMWPARYGGIEWKKTAEYGSLFGTVKILAGPVDAQPDAQLRIYFQDGLVQNTLDAANRSQSFFTYGLEGLVQAYRPQASSALVLGLGAGVVPMTLARNGVDVTAVEIDPVSFEVAQRHFGFDTARVRAVEADARTFLRGCKAGYDVIVVDLFHGDGIPEYLITRDFFNDLRTCLKPDGVAVFNTFVDLDRPSVYAHFLVTLHSELPEIVVYRPDAAGARHVNSFVVASAARLVPPEPVRLRDAPPRHAATLQAMLERPNKLDSETLRRGAIITDARNTISLDIADAQMAYRRLVIETVPPAFLLN
ncbi:MAG: fused MFS/spermidine synthase [Burkholderiales bacterium]|nr:fused MFS/spermidine synthase [Burkholderiales bacterium]